MGFANLAAFEHLAEIGCGEDLAGGAGALVDAFVEGGVGALSASQDRPPITSAVSTSVSAASSASVPTASMACVPLISEIGFFGLEHQRLDLRRLSASTLGMRVASCVDAFAFADQSQREMGQGREITAGADAALRGNTGVTPRLSISQSVSMMTARTPEKSFSQRVGAQQHHGAGFGNGERFADADGVGADEIDLQFADLVAGDAHVAELANAGGDGIGELVVCDDVVDHGAGAIDGLARIGREQHGAAVVGDFADRFEGEVVTVDVEGVQRFQRVL